MRGEVAPAPVGWALAALLLSGCGLQSGSGASTPIGGRVSRAVQAGTYSKAEYHTILVQKGQSVVVNYDVTVNRGSFTVAVRPYQMIGLAKPLNDVRVTQTKKGTLTVAVPSTGVYEVGLRPFGLNGSYDVSWSAR